MAHDETLAARIRPMLTGRDGLSERRMSGGVGWFVRGNMACAVMGVDLVVRLAPEDARETVASDPHARPFARPGSRPMKGFVVVAPEAVGEDGDLVRWVDAGAEFAASLPAK